jgi:hypothetical protein
MDRLDQIFIACLFTPLSRLTMHLLCILTLALDISPNNGPIRLNPGTEMIVYVLAIQFEL